MVTSTHETLHRFFRDHPEEIDRTFHAVGLKTFPPTVKAWELSNDVTTFAPLERRVDSVMRLQAADGHTFIVVFEAQSRPDKAKQRSRPYYVAYLHERYQCPVMLVVICQDLDTAAWARTPVRISTRFWTSLELNPWVLGPENVPIPAEIDASNVHLGALSVIIHGRDVDETALRRLADAVLQAGDEIYADLGTYVQLGLGSLPAAHIWRKMMTMDLETLRTSPILREILDDHDSDVKAANVLRILNARSIELDNDQRSRITDCTDVARLDAWFDAAIDAACAADVFAAHAPAEADTP
ncbi:hypothetical protein [Actinospica robiniae]|uniref:hypothetical protein n=1 Tax=Actinospica robiniae TaxID=304901 RepID=UPI00041DF08C|nr:hypothetical protein [Actinospica robiniae]